MAAASEPGNRKVTRRDVARHAGVSDAVVSYTLNGGPPVAPATAARVRESVRLLGYTPNAAARALRMGSSRLIGIVVPDSRNPFWAELCHAVEILARARGFAVLVVNTDDDSSLTIEYFQSLASRQVDGVLIAASIEESDVARLNAVGVPWALLNKSTPVAGTRGTGVDLVAGARTATDHLIGHGYGRIGFVGRIDDPRYLGWRDTVVEAGLEPGPVFDTTFVREGGYTAGRELAAAHNELDAVFVSSDMLATGVLRALHEAGLGVPSDVAIASFDGSPESEYSWPGLTTVRQPIDELALNAVEQLLDPSYIDNRRIEGNLVVRESCGCHPSIA